MEFNSAFKGLMPVEALSTNMKMKRGSYSTVALISILTDSVNKRLKTNIY